MVKLAQLKAWLGSHVDGASTRLQNRNLQDARRWLDHCAEKGYPRKTLDALVALDLTEASIEGGRMKVEPSIDVSGDYARYEYRKYQKADRPWTVFGRVETWSWRRYFFTFTLAGPPQRGSGPFPRKGAGPDLSSHQGRHRVTVHVAGARQDLAIAAYRFLDSLADKFNREGR